MDEDLRAQDKVKVLNLYDVQVGLELLRDCIKKQKTTLQVEVKKCMNDLIIEVKKNNNNKLIKKKKERRRSKLKLKTIFQGYAKSWEARYRPIYRGEVRQISSPLSQFPLTLQTPLRNSY